MGHPGQLGNMLTRKAADPTKPWALGAECILTMFTHSTFSLAIHEM